MIIVKLMGGLGNQMFQYATGYRLAQLHNSQLKLDISSLSGAGIDLPRDYELKHLSVTAGIATAAEIELLRRQGNEPVQRLLSSVSSLLGRKLPMPGDYSEPHFHYDPNFLVTPDNSYLDGYWQSEKYFVCVSANIREEFSVRNSLEGLNLELAKRIGITESVSIHVRRGDYIANPVTASFHGTCSLEYYGRAIELIYERLKHPQFFVFSDDPSWVQANLVVPLPATFITHNASSGHEDLRLMSLCKHHIIANSSFSWWGAWLNYNPEKIVVSPSRWFMNPDTDTSDLLPESWLRIAT